MDLTPFRTFESMFDLHNHPPFYLNKLRNNSNSINVDLEEKKDSFVINADLPGVNRNDINITIYSF